MKGVEKEKGGHESQSHTLTAEYSEQSAARSIPPLTSYYSYSFTLFPPFAPSCLFCIFGGARVCMCDDNLIRGKTDSQTWTHTYAHKRIIPFHEALLLMSDGIRNFCLFPFTPLIRLGAARHVHAQRMIEELMAGFSMPNQCHY